MRLILTQDVTGLGGPGEVVEVADGYGRNYLLPRKLAIAATRGAEKQIATIRRAREVREVSDRSQAQQLAGQLAALPIRLVTRAGTAGRLFGSVTAADVVAAVREAGGPSLDRRYVEMPVAHIKSTGTYAIGVRLHPEVSATLSVDVVAS
jgi:large subunit ribosomal protein L9